MKKIDDAKINRIISQKQKMITTGKMADAVQLSAVWIKNLWAKYGHTGYDDVMPDDGHAIFGILETNLCIKTNMYSHYALVGMSVVTKERMDLFAEMEAMYEKRDTEYFVKLLTHEDYVIRTRATCILVDFGGEDKVAHIAQVLKEDPNELVRHEAAFSLGQMCHPSGIASLASATRSDSSMFVRHEAAIALGVIGSKDAKKILQDALNDPEKPVVESAVVALSNIEFMETICTNEKFAKLTGG